MGDPAPSRARASAAGLGARTVLVVLALALAVAAADRAGARVDVSADHRHSLDPRLVERLRTAPGPVELIAAWADDGEDVALDDEQLRGLEEALAAMARAGRDVVQRHLDPRREPHLVDAFAARYGRFGGPGIYVALGQRARKIPLHAGTSRTLQREIAGALIALADPRPPVARLMQGHGELRPGGGAIDGVDALAAALRTAGFSVALLAPGEAPAADDVLVVAGAESPLGPDLARLEDHLVDGGAALVLADDRTPPDLARALAHHGVLLGPGIPRRVVAGDASALADDAAPTLPARLLLSRARYEQAPGDVFPFANLRIDGELLNPDHPATAPVARSGRAVISPESTVGAAATASELDLPAEAIARALAAHGTPDFSVVALARTAPGDAWKTRRGEPLSRPPAGGEAPSQALGWALTYPVDARAAARPAAGERPAAQGARLVVWASRQAGADAWAGRGDLANADLLVDAARWLAGRGPAEDIPPAETAAYRVDAGPRGLWTTIALLVAVLPSALVGVALLVWWEHR